MCMAVHMVFGVSVAVGCVMPPFADGRDSWIAVVVKAIIVVCADPFFLRWQSRVCLWCALVRCLTFLFVPLAPKHHRTTHHGKSTHLLHFGVTGFLLSCNKYQWKARCGVRTAATRGPQRCCERAIIPLPSESCKWE